MPKKTTNQQAVKKIYKAESESHPDVNAAMRKLGTLPKAGGGSTASDMAEEYGFDTSKPMAQPKVNAAGEPLIDGFTASEWKGFGMKPPSQGGGEIPKDTAKSHSIEEALLKLMKGGDIQITRREPKEPITITRREPKEPIQITRREPNPNIKITRREVPIKESLDKGGSFYGGAREPSRGVAQGKLPAGNTGYGREAEVARQHALQQREIETSNKAFANRRRGGKQEPFVNPKEAMEKTNAEVDVAPGVKFHPAQQTHPEHTRIPNEEDSRTYSPTSDVSTPEADPHMEEVEAKYDTVRDSLSRGGREGGGMGVRSGTPVPDHRPGRSHMTGGAPERRKVPIGKSVINSLLKLMKGSGYVDPPRSVDNRSEAEKQADVKEGAEREQAILDRKPGGKGNINHSGITNHVHSLIREGKNPQAEMQNNPEAFARGAGIHNDINPGKLLDSVRNAVPHVTPNGQVSVNGKPVDPNHSFSQKVQESKHLWTAPTGNITPENPIPPGAMFPDQQPNAQPLKMPPKNPPIQQSIENSLLKLMKDGTVEKGVRENLGRAAGQAAQAGKEFGVGAAGGFRRGKRGTEDTPSTLAGKIGQGVGGAVRGAGRETLSQLGSVPQEMNTGYEYAVGRIREHPKDRARRQAMDAKFADAGYAKPEAKDTPVFLKPPPREGTMGQRFGAQAKEVLPRTAGMVGMGLGAAAAQFMPGAGEKKSKPMINAIENSLLKLMKAPPLQGREPRPRPGLRGLDFSSLPIGASRTGEMTPEVKTNYGPPKTPTSSEPSNFQTGLGGDETSASERAEIIRGGPPTSPYPKEMTRVGTDEELQDMYDQEAKRGKYKVPYTAEQKAAITAKRMQTKEKNKLRMRESREAAKKNTPIEDALLKLMKAPPQPGTPPGAPVKPNKPTVATPGASGGGTPGGAAGAPGGAAKAAPQTNPQIQQPASFQNPQVKRPIQASIEESLLKLMKAPTDLSSQRRQAHADNVGKTRQTSRDAGAGGREVLNRQDLNVQPGDTGAGEAHALASTAANLLGAGAAQDFYGKLGVKSPEEFASTGGVGDDVVRYGGETKTKDITPVPTTTTGNDGSSNNPPTPPQAGVGDGSETGMPQTPKPNTASQTVANLARTTGQPQQGSNQVATALSRIQKPT